MTRTMFDQSLTQMHHELLQMGSLIEQQIQDTIEALTEQDVELANKIIKRDDEIDELEESLEKEAITLIATQQPLASDLRTIASIMKIVTDLERIADHCSDISQYTIKLAEQPYLTPVVLLPRMADHIRKMVADTIQAYISKDVRMAQMVIEFDDVVDQDFDNVVEKLKGLMKENPEIIDQGVNFIMIAKYLERMADHATNVCNWIIYNVTGELDQHNN